MSNTSALATTGPKNVATEVERDVAAATQQVPLAPTAHGSPDAANEASEDADIESDARGEATAADVRWVPLVVPLWRLGAEPSRRATDFPEADVSSSRTENSACCRLFARHLGASVA